MRTPTLARLMFRLEMLSYKLDLARDHWPNPSSCVDDDLGAVALVHEVARQLDVLYADLSDWATASGQDKSLDEVTSFLDGEDEHPEPQQTSQDQS